MPKSSFVDFRAVKAAITMEQVLRHYGLIDQFKKSEKSLMPDRILSDLTPQEAADLVEYIRSQGGGK